MASTLATTARIGSAPSWASSLGGYYYAAGDAWYTVVQNTSDAGIQVMKAAYAGTSFAEQDAARNLTAIDSNSPFDWFPSGNFLYVVYFSTATGLRVRRFNMSTDLWELTDIGNATFATADQAYPVRIAVRSDGDILVGYGPTTLAANLTRYEGAGWQTPVNMLTSAVITDIAMDADDTAWLIMVDTAAADLTVRSYSSTNVAGTVTDLDTAIDVLSARTNQSVVYNDGTADRIGCGARDSTDEYDFWHFTTTGTIPGSPGVVNAVSDTDFDLQPTTIASAVVGTTIVTVWPKVNLIKYNISDDLATPVFSLTASQVGGTFTDTDPCPLIMTDGTAWGVVYQDSGTVSIEWIVAPSVSAGATGTVTTGTATATGLAVTATVSYSGMVATGTATAAGHAHTATAGVTATAATGTATASGESQTGTVTAGGVDATGTITMGTATATGQSQTATAGGMGTVATGTATASGQSQTASAGVTATATTGTATASGQSHTGRSGGTGTVATGTATATGLAQTGTVTAGGGVTGTVSTGSATATGLSHTANAGTRGTVTTGSATTQGLSHTVGISAAGVITTGAATASGQAHTAIAGVTGIVATGTAIASGLVVTGNDGSIVGELSAVLVISRALDGTLTIEPLLDARLTVDRTLTAELTAT